MFLTISLRDQLNELILKFFIPPSIICLSEIRINHDPSININIPGYIFIHLPSSSKAGGVCAYLSNTLKFTENYSLQLNIKGCENLWLNIEILGEKSKFTFAVIYCHPCNNISFYFIVLSIKMRRDVFFSIYFDVLPGNKCQASSEKQNSGWKNNPK